MNDIATLWYVDSRRLARGFIDIFRRPSRLLVWLFIALYFGFQWFIRQHAARTNILSLLPPVTDRVAGALLAVAFMLGSLLLWNAARAGRVNTGTQPVEVLFFARSSIPQPVVAAWVYLRYVLFAYGRFLAGLAYFAIVLRSLNAPSVLAFAGIFATVEILRIPVASAARSHRWIVSALLALAIAGALMFAIQISFPILHLGFLLTGLLNGDRVELAIVYAALATAVLAAWWTARDIYPEMYAASTQRALLLQRRRRFAGALGTLETHKPTKSGTTVLAGPWVEIWKQFAFARRGNGKMFVGIGLALSVIVGVAAGIADRYDNNAGFAALAVFAVLCMLALTLSSVTLALDLAKPLWWLGQGTVFEKLCAWAIGSSLPATVLIAISALTYAVFAGPASLPIFLLGAIALPAPTRGLGALIYSFVPNRIDQRGPAMILRMLFLYATLIVMGVIWLLAAIVFRSPWIGGLIAIAAFVAEGAVALVIAAWRIDGRGVEFASAE